MSMRTTAVSVICVAALSAAPAHAQTRPGGRPAHRRRPARPGTAGYFSDAGMRSAACTTRVTASGSIRSDTSPVPSSILVR